MYARCDLTKVEQRSRIISCRITLLPMQLWMHPRIQLVFWSASAHCQLMFSFSSTRTPKSSSARFLSVNSSHSLYSCLGLWNFTRFLCQNQFLTTPALWKDETISQTALKQVKDTGWWKQMEALKQLRSVCGKYLMVGYMIKVHYTYIKNRSTSSALFGTGAGIWNSLCSCIHFAIC